MSNNKCLDCFNVAWSPSLYCKACNGETTPLKERAMSTCNCQGREGHQHGCPAIPPTNNWCQGFCTLCGTGCEEYCTQYREIRRENAALQSMCEDKDRLLQEINDKAVTSTLSHFEDFERSAHAHSEAMNKMCEAVRKLDAENAALRAELADTEQRRLSALGMIDEMSKENWELLEKGFPVPPEEVKALRAACEVYEEALASISLPLRGSTEVDKLLETMNNDMDIASEALARGRVLKEG